MSYKRLIAFSSFGVFVKRREKEGERKRELRFLNAKLRLNAVRLFNSDVFRETINETDIFIELPHFTF